MKKVVRPSLLSLLILPVILSGCSSDSKLISAGEADQIVQDLNRAKSAVDDGRCEDATRTINSVQDQISDLPNSVDQELRNELNEGVSGVSDQIQEQCVPEPTTDENTTIEVTTETTTQSTETVPTAPTTDVTPTTTQTTVTTPTVTQTTTTTPTSTEPTGGVQAPVRGLVKGSPR